MPEDQGVNGDRWTEEASRLLRQLQWEKIADSNIDIQGADGHVHGIDALFRYDDGWMVDGKQGVFVEAKRYETTSFRVTKLQDWIDRLDEKILELKRSELFYTTYPAMRESLAHNGLLVLWFHDKDKYTPEFRRRLGEAMTGVRTPRRRGGSQQMSRLFVIDNWRILRLASLVEAKKKWETDKSRNGQFDAKQRFYYPGNVSRHPSREITALNLECMLSDFVLARSQELDNYIPKAVDIVYYFGKPTTPNFAQLQQALISFDMLNNSKKLYVYYYERDDEFRKVEPDVRKLFGENRHLELSFQPMQVFADLPNWMLPESGDN
jgi:hypothetical protein